MRRETMVLTVPAEAVEFLYHTPKFWSDGETFRIVRSLISQHGVFVERAWAEENPSVKQIVSFAVIHNGSKLFSLQRSRSDSRATLRLRNTLLFGGHVDDAERYSESPAEDCLRRELSEELGLETTRKPAPLGIVADPESDSGILHLGLIYRITHHSEFAHITSVPGEESEFEIVDAVRKVKMIPWQKIPRMTYSLDRWSMLLAYSGALDPVLRVPLRKHLPPQIRREYAV